MVNFFDDYKPTQVLSNQLSPHILYSKVIPTGTLSDHVECFWELSTKKTLPKPTTLAILPDGCVDIVFDLSNKKAIKAWVSGAMSTVSNVTLNNTSHFFGVRFWPGKLYTLVHVPMKTFTKQDVPLDRVLPNAKLFIAQIATTSSFHQRIAIAEAFCTSLPPATHIGDQHFLRVIQTILQERGHVNITALAQQQNITERQLRRCFENYIGLSPKTFTRTIRFQYLLHELLKTKKSSSIHQALQYGYYDQSHLINDLRAICQLTPQQFAHFIGI